jgi:pyruvate-ferredoxin/flavodoxin oxidoreductase
MGANKNQMMKAFVEAESFPGPSIIIAYAPCINQGIRKGMGKTQEQTKLAVDCGYWPLFRYDPRLAEEGKNPFQLDSKAPDGSLQEFLSGENRYGQLERFFPEESKVLRAEIDREIQERWNILKLMSEVNPYETAHDVSLPGPSDAGEACELAPSDAEQAKPDSGEPCDDGRAGK